MEKRNVYLGQVGDKYGNNVFLPYSVGMIASYCLSIDGLRENFEFNPPLFLKEDIEIVVKKLNDPKVLGLSSYIWNFEYNKKLAEAVKSKYPSCLVVFGGHQIPFESENFFARHNYVDILVHGDGEVAFAEILLALLSPGKDFRRISNLSVNLGGETFKTKKEQKKININKIPSPYLSGVFDGIIKLPYSFTASLETNRGCPYGCAYCDWGSPLTNCKTIVPFDEQRVKDEIEWFGKNKIEFVMGCDSNFGILQRDNDFVDKFIEIKNKYDFPKKFRTAYAKNSNQAIFEMNKKLNENKMCKGVTLSFQSLNAETLKAVGRINLRIDNFKELLRQYNNENISTYTEIILGLPNESRDTFCAGLDTLLVNGQHSSINVYNCEILPNSLMGDKKYKEFYGIKSVRVPAVLSHSVPSANNIQEYDEIVIGTNAMSTEDWKKSCIFSWAVQCFHCLGLTQHAAIFAHNERSISYAQFYNDLIKHGENSPGSIIGREVNLISRIIDGVINGGSWEFVIEKFGAISWPTEEGSFLNIIVAKERFYEELKKYLSSYFGKEEEEKISDLIKYSAKMLIDPFRRSASELDLNWDFNKYFNEFYRGTDKPSLVYKKNKLLFHDIEEFGGDLPSYAREIIWYGRKGGKFFHGQHKIKERYIE
ncbi:MAG: cobalamin-dependent protein [Patescibacteria group bacterium]|nr:cobalamin-dependent protein [Patescibacteria group bacterium]